MEFGVLKVASEISRSYTAERVTLECFTHPVKTVKYNYIYFSNTHFIL